MVTFRNNNNNNNRRNNFRRNERNFKSNGDRPKFGSNFSNNENFKRKAPERYRGRIHFELDKCIACEVCVRVCPINLPVVDWVMNKEAKKKELRNYSIDFGVCIFCGNCVEYCPTNCLSMTEEYELSTFDRHSLNFDNVALGRLPTNVTTDPSVRAMRELAYLPKGKMDPHEVPDNEPRVGAR